ncbi:hypothetical protein NDU88_000442 [Pleurodeles waltl]|uniref:Uncharacterized protein n=1 Tax=Pleurodeles waltl TaxID=8319 RepID=A0AAV7TGD4_PLEWA|nr:hypothetical protein NDU88_000442 [Pleurodeles waltl]
MVLVARTIRLSNRQSAGSPTLQEYKEAFKRIVSKEARPSEETASATAPLGMLHLARSPGGPSGARWCRRSGKARKPRPPEPSTKPLLPPLSLRAAVLQRGFPASEEPGEQPLPLG